MRLIDRLYKYLEHKSTTAYAFEKTCGIANGYLKKQYNGKGSVGSDILDKIHKHYPDLNTLWLLTGEGEMLSWNEEDQVTEQEKKYQNVKDEMIALLKRQLALMEKNIADKETIIRLLEEQLQHTQKK